MNSATESLVRSFTNTTDNEILFIVVINGETGSYIVSSDNGKVYTYSRTAAYDVLDNYQDDGEYGDVIEVVPGETFDLNGSSDDDSEEDDGVSALIEFLS